MILTIRKSKATKVVAAYLSLNLLFQLATPIEIIASTSGPSQPEFNSFTPVGVTDMVDLSSGSFNYNIPIMDVGGYPINLSYASGTTVDQEASWTGLNWNLNVGQINRQVRGLPDDFKGDEMVYENNLRPNVTVGINPKIDIQFYGVETTDQVGGAVSSESDTSETVKLSLGLGIKYNNYHGLSFMPSYGLSFGLSDAVSVGINVQTSATEGASISPQLNIKTGLGKKLKGIADGALNAGLSYNSLRGLTQLNLGATVNGLTEIYDEKSKEMGLVSLHSITPSTTISFNSPSLTPRKRTAFVDNNATFSFSVGPDVMGGDVEGELSASLSVQKIKDKIKREKAYGYEHSGKAGPDDVLDYNRENDRIISKQLLALPYTNYTYDLYAVQAQGISGQFRAYRGQIGQIYDERVEDYSQDVSVGAEIEPGTGVHFGGNFVASPSKSHTGKWRTKASSSFVNEHEEVIDKDYEAVYFKYVGERSVDDERALYTEALKGDKAIDVKLEGHKFGKYADTKFRVKNYDPLTNAVSYSDEPFTGTFKRTKREIRNQGVQKFTVAEMPEVYNSPAYLHQRISPYAADHHTAEIRVVKADGATYVFGEAAYNVEKQEVTFTTNGTGNNSTGIVRYQPGENSINNSSGIDHFYNKTITPAYAHTYLLSSVLSSDYEDKTGDGPTNDDFGSYTLFEYEKKEDEPYKWRIPYGSMEASYDAGLNSSKTDQKGSYLYGEKEIKYLKKISTKTHVALFTLSEREDARGVVDENGGGGSTSGHLYKLDQVRLYSRPEYIKYAAELEDDDSSNDPTAQELSPIKTAFFEYNYELCNGVPNNLQGGGKLTLKKVYFTYRNSEMGMHEAYEFSYDSVNPTYNMKSYDVWGNYAPNTVEPSWNVGTPITKAEFPFIDQENRSIQDQYASSWALKQIKLPSGGAIEIDYESNDYQYVQDRNVMSMYKVTGAGGVAKPTSLGTVNNHYLYKFDGNNDAKYLYVKLPKETAEISSTEFKERYLKGLDNKPIYFRFLLNMTKKGANLSSRTDFDYVTGYFTMDQEVKTFKLGSDVYASIPMKKTDMEGGVSGDRQVNPISKAGWYFGRSYLNGIVYGLNMDYQSESVETIAKKLYQSIGAVTELVTGPNAKLRSNAHSCARRFIPNKSWVRLGLPDGVKIGGGERVKSIKMYDGWDEMSLTGVEQVYGQEYTYTLENGTSSGVATFEPNNCAENPFVEPFYNKDERLIAPREVNYVEKPFGKAFFPGARVTYSRVTVKSLAREKVSKHATGKTVTMFYTSKDFPTKVDYTDVQNKYTSNQNKALRNIINGLLSLPVRTKTEFALSQGFVVHTNDMDGKMKRQEVYQEGAETPISTVEYKYNTQEDNAAVLNNIVPVIHKGGAVRYDQEVGVDYDVITDFRESYSKLENKGVNINVVTLFLPPAFPTIPTFFTTDVKIENLAHSVITTKVVHTAGILKETIATDLGSKVSTVNQAWDAQTGEVLLTKTENEYDDAYYNFSFPAYWAYRTQAPATTNLNMRGTLNVSGDYFTYPNASQYFALGDELIGRYGNNQVDRFWVVELNPSGNGVLLMNRAGAVINRGGISITSNIDFKIVRSGFRNVQLANMAAVTMMKNPLIASNGIPVTQLTSASFTQPVNIPVQDRLKIINASAIAYSDFWNCQCESELPFIPYASTSVEELADLPIEEYLFNPYVYNVKGDWKAKKSYAYLTEREDVAQGEYQKTNNRKEGYFKEFSPYYSLGTDQWQVDETGAANWTFASEVTKYSPFGAELENKDALERYSSAQYGYNFTSPVAVAANSKYRYMGSDNFEDYEFLNTNKAHFSFKEQVVADGNYGIEVSHDQAHTGYQSLLIPSGDKAVKEVELIGIEAEDNDFDNDGRINIEDNCPYTFNPFQADYDQDNIGDACDDYAVPRIVDLRYSGQIGYYKEQASFRIEGTPNTEVEFKLVPQIDPHSLDYPGTGIQVNGGPVKSNHYIDTLIKNSENDIVNTIRLDVTGRAYVKIQAKARRKKGQVSLHLFLCKNGIPIPHSISPVVDLNPYGCRRHKRCKDKGQVQLFSFRI